MVWVWAGAVVIIPDVEPGVGVEPLSWSESVEDGALVIFPAVTVEDGVISPQASVSRYHNPVKMIIIPTKVRCFDLLLNF